MIVEVLVVLAFLIGGSALAAVYGVRGWAVPAVGFALGVAVHVGLVGALTVASLPSPPWLGVMLTLLGPLAWWGWRWHQGDDVPVAPIPTLGVLAATVGLVLAARAANLVNFTPDSFRYLTTAGLLNGGRLDDASPFLLESRVLAVPAMHAPAGLSGELYLRSVTPLLALSGVLVLVWLVTVGLRTFDGPPSPTLIAVAAAALLVTTNRFVFHAFYINGHGPLATWLLILGGASWLAVRRADEVGGPQLTLLQATVLPAIVLARPDGGVLAGLVLLPLLTADGVPARLRWVGLGVLGLTMTAWQGFLVSFYRSAGGDVPFSVTALLLVGIGAVLGALSVRRLGTAWLPRRSLGLTELVLWGAAGVAIAFDPQVLLDSARATVQNTGWEGGWGVSLLMLAGLAVAVLMATDVPGRAVLRFPLTAFVPLAILLAYLRGNAYRVGPGDSLNRMLIHLVPMLILFLVASFPSERWTWRRSDASSAVAMPSQGES